MRQTIGRLGGGRLLLAAAIAAAGIASCSARAPAEQANGVPQGENWASIQRLPDWSGTWQAVSFKKHMYGPGRAPFRDLHPPFNPATLATFENMVKIAVAGKEFPSRIDHCISFGFPYDMDHPSVAAQFLFTPGQVTMAAAEFVRRIYTDGRKHNEDLTTFQGDSIGHWEAGGVLVTDTVALDAGNEIVMGIPMGEGVHVTERLALRDQNTLVDQVTVNAPSVLAQPWTYEVEYQRTAAAMHEYDCAQDNRDVSRASGERGFDLTPPPGT